MGSNSYVMSLGQIFLLALKRWWIILIAMVLGAALMFGYTYYLVTPMYTSKALTGVKVPDMNAYNDSMTGQKVARECSDILMSDITLDRAAAELNSEGMGIFYTGAKLRSMIGTVVDEETRFFQVHVTNADPKEAQRVCQKVIESFNVILKEKNIINEAEGITLNYATLPTSPSSPNMTTNIVIGALIGLIISFGVLIIIGFFKDSIDGEDFLVSVYGDKIPMLAVLPDANTSSAYYKKYARKYGYGYADDQLAVDMPETQDEN